jgi:endonuclease YncB( thermonuclease family)
MVAGIKIRIFYKDTLYLHAKGKGNAWKCGTQTSRWAQNTRELRKYK